MKKRYTPTRVSSAVSQRKESALRRTAVAANQFEASSWGRLLLKRYVQVAFDIIVTVISLSGAFYLRFDGLPPHNYLRSLFVLFPLVILARVGANSMAGIYARVWRYASVGDAFRLAVAGAFASGILLFLRVVLGGHSPLVMPPLGVILMDYMLATAGMLGLRIARRVIYESATKVRRRTPDVKQRTLLVGAGEAGVMAAREIMRRPDLGVEICGFVDDDPNKHRALIQGVRILGHTQQLPDLIASERISHVIITMASASRKTVRGVLNTCKAAGVTVKIIPGLYEILGDHVTVSDVRPVGIEDLLGRDTINLNSWVEATKLSYAGARILITGAGGSIGRELCRQVLALGPAEIILLDKDENSVFEVEQELKANAESRKVVLHPVICDLRYIKRLSQVFDRYSPQIIFHAAAHKHVPLMEFNPSEAVLNNVIGTATLLDLCARHKTKQCVMVSTDKAVNPTNIMGATKRVAELLFQAQAAKTDDGCRYSCVRFGNVLGSRGSVIPSFREQIRKGGPVTVTHPDMIRYFMTIPEAAQLIIEAGMAGTRGEIFLLDMGEPVKVLDLAKDMIHLSGLTLGEDIDIEFIGLRPGEKLREELLIAEEGAEATKYEKIFMAPPLNYPLEQLNFWVHQLRRAADDGDDAAIYHIFSEMNIGFRSDKYPPITQDSELEKEPPLYLEANV